MPGGALSRYKVVEIGQGVSAPYCARLFADYGADVVKVEPPGRRRHAGAGARFRATVPHPEKSGLFFFLNTNKRSVTLDVDDGARPRDRLLELLASADVLIENHAPATHARLGARLRHRSARPIPDLVMISITPFGQTGPYARLEGLRPQRVPPLGRRQPLLRPAGRDAARARHLLGRLLRRLRRRRLGTRGGARPRARRRRAARRLSPARRRSPRSSSARQNIGGYAQDGVFETRSGVGMRARRARPPSCPARTATSG